MLIGKLGHPQKKKEDKYKPANPAKYKGDVKNIVYRSWLEFRIFRLLDDAPHVDWWCSEELYVPYVSPADKKPHRYYPDVIYQVTKNGATTIYMMEIKPSSQVEAPKMQKSRKTGRDRKRRFLTESLTFAVNQAKWNAAKAFCARNGWKWRVMTEKDVGGWSGTGGSI